MITISKVHRRAVASTLLLIDEGLCRFEDWVSGREARSVLYRERNRMTEEKRRKLVVEIAAMRKLIEEFTGDLRLETDERDVSLEMWAYVLSFRHYLLEMQGKRLRRYGRLSSQSVEYIDQKSQSLLERIEKVLEILSAKTGGSGAP